ncbi:MAG: GAF domain-containing protein [Verrucomicrobia bacterium]|nr:GAF domain-containing protein [Verrucomicrobiota bacterium]
MKTTNEREAGADRTNAANATSNLLNKITELQCNCIRRLAGAIDSGFAEHNEKEIEKGFLDEVVKLATGQFKAAACSVFTIKRWGDDRGVAVMAAGTGYHSENVGKIEYDIVPAKKVVEPPSDGERLGLTGLVISTGRPFLFNSVDELASHPHRLSKGVPEDCKVAAFLGMPLRSPGGTVIGMLKAERLEGAKPFELDEQIQLEAIAQMTGRGIFHLRDTVEKASESSVVAWVIDVISDALATRSEPDEFLDTVVNVVAAASLADSCSVFVIDESKITPSLATLTQRAGCGNQRLAKVIRAYRLPEPDERKALLYSRRRLLKSNRVGITAWIAATGLSLYAEDKKELRRHHHHKGGHDKYNYKRGEKMGAFYGVPLRVGGMITGVLKVENTVRKNEIDRRKFSAQVRARVDSLSQYVALAIERSIREGTSRYQVILDVTEHMAAILRKSGTLEEEDLVKEVVNVTRRYLRAQTCVIYLTEGNWLVRHPWAVERMDSGCTEVRNYKLNKAEAVVDQPTQAQKCGIAGWICSKGEPFTARSTLELKMHPHWLETDSGEAIAGEQCESFMGQPLMVGKNILGVITVVNKMRNKDFTYFSQQDELALKVIANWATSAIQYARVSQRLSVTRHRFALAALMARNLSHNIGSHVLADAGLLDDAGISDKGEENRAVRLRLTTFHGFLQGRLDFIARALGESESMVQPMFFRTGVLAALESQYLLMKNLLKDHQFDMPEFESDMTKLAGGHGSGGSGSNAKEGASDRDVLVGIPGGTVGCHAFHALIENILRNAVKYGGKFRSEKRIVTTLILRHGKALDPEEKGFIVDCYWLDITENSGSTGPAADMIRDYLSESIITPDGAPVVHGHGIQEMKACAKFLANGLVFPKDGERLWQDFPSDPYPYRKPTGGSTDVLDSGNGALLAWFNRETSELTYRCILRKPVIYGILADVKPASAVSGHTWFNSIEELARSPAHFGLVLRREFSPADTTLVDIARFHHALPFRLLVVTPDKRAWSAWKEAIQNVERLPVRRVHVVCLPEFFRESDPLPDFETNEGAELYVKLCDEWLKAWKGDGGVRLRIGFDRADEHQSVPRWKESAKLFQSTVVSGEIVTAQEGVQKQRFEFSKSTSAAHTWITFDNHCNCGFENCPVEMDLKPPAEKQPNLYHVYHGFAGNEQPQLAAALEHPPGSGFPFAYYLYSLVEASLLRVIVIDERVAGSIFNQASGKAQIDIGRLNRLQFSGVFPLFRLTVEPDRTFQFTPDASSPPCDRELGLRLSSPLQIKALTFGKSAWKGWRCADLLTWEPDILVVHEGLLDHFPLTRSIWGSWAVLLEEIRQVPRLVRTSGRGSRSRKELEHIPFLELVVLSDTTYQQMNKVALGTALMGVRGTVSE